MVLGSGGHSFFKAIAWKAEQCHFGCGSSKKNAKETSNM